MTPEVYHSPDGALTFVVEHVEDGDSAVGFAQSEWHTHANLLVPIWGATWKEAVQAFTSAVLRGDAVIGVRRKGGVIVEAWISADPASEADLICKGETLEMRYWDGRPWVPRGGDQAYE